MLVRWVSGNKDAPCYLLEWPDEQLRVVIDCMLWFPDRTSFSIPFPETFDWSIIDAVILTHHDYWSALPFLFSFGRNGDHFSGVIYATLPTLKLGELVCRELCECYNSNINGLPQIYTDKDIEQLLSFARCVGYGEVIQLKPNVSFKLCSAGSALGSSSAVFQQLDGRKLAYVSCASIHSFRHPREFDLASISDVNAVVLATAPTSASSRFIENARSLGEAVVTGLQRTSMVVIPILPANLLVDVVEIIREQTRTVSGLESLRIHYVSSVANDAAALLSILGEWMSEVPQSKLYIPQPPVLYEASGSSGLPLQDIFLKHDDLHDVFRSSEPYLILAAHASACAGPTAWLNDEYSILINPEFSHLHPGKNVERIILDPRLTAEQQLELVERNFRRTSVSFVTDAAAYPGDRRELLTLLSPNEANNVFEAPEEQLFTLATLPVTSLPPVNGESLYCLNANGKQTIPVRATINFGTNEIEKLTLLSFKKDPLVTESAKDVKISFGDETVTFKGVSSCYNQIFPLASILDYMAEFILCPEQNLGLEGGNSETFSVDHGLAGKLEFIPSSDRPHTIVYTRSKERKESASVCDYFVNRLKGFFTGKTYKYILPADEADQN